MDEGQEGKQYVLEDKSLIVKWRQQVHKQHLQNNSCS